LHGRCFVPAGPGSCRPTLRPSEWPAECMGRDSSRSLAGARPALRGHDMIAPPAASLRRRTRLAAPRRDHERRDLAGKVVGYLPSACDGTTPSVAARSTHCLQTSSGSPYSNSMSSRDAIAGGWARDRPVATHAGSRRWRTGYPSRRSNSGGEDGSSHTRAREGNATWFRPAWLSPT
jgi:hypothetical protein